jgi:Outer membrane protein beta-barrel domain
MKKIVILFSSILLFQFTNAQKGFRIGAKAGLNANKIEGQSFNDGFNASFQAGGFIEIDFSKKFGIQPEVLWTQSKTTFVSNINSLTPGTFTSGVNNVTLNYLSIPILFRISTGKMLTWVVGPQYSILIDQNKNLLQNGKDAFSAGEFAMAGGLQINLSALRIYGRYVAGLSNISEVTNTSNWKNQAIQVGVGLRL